LQLLGYILSLGSTAESFNNGLCYHEGLANVEDPWLLSNMSKYNIHYFEGGDRELLQTIVPLNERESRQPCQIPDKQQILRLRSVRFRCLSGALISFPPEALWETGASIGYTMVSRIIFLLLKLLRWALRLPH
jgi:hypothetical protein